MEDIVSDRQSVLTGEGQSSVLAPLLFLVYINDLDDYISSHILTFADDTKLFRKAVSYDDTVNSQDDSDQFVKCSEKWQMVFNFDKCKCLHLGHTNPHLTYTISNAVTCTTKSEKDLEI